MNIIIPLGGKGERFAKEGYTQPKPLIPIFNTCMIEYVLDHLTLSENDNVFVVYNEGLDEFAFRDEMIGLYPFLRFVRVGETKGAAETLQIGLSTILSTGDFHDRCLILDCDTFYTEDIVGLFRESQESMVFYTKNYETTPIYY
jgi:NDP-sugar pyrophosphorylase family protein